jgi:hypothetical protein
MIVRTFKAKPASLATTSEGSAIRQKNPMQIDITFIAIPPPPDLQGYVSSSGYLNGGILNANRSIGETRGKPALFIAQF